VLLTYGNAQVPTAICHKSSDMIEDYEGQMKLIRHVSILVIEPLASFHMPTLVSQKYELSSFIPVLMLRSSLQGVRRRRKKNLRALWFFQRHSIGCL
jgi:hypothetical protein